MNIWRLVLREIGHRKGNFVLGLLSVAAAVGSLVGALTLLKADEIRTAQLLAEKQDAVKQAGAELEDAMRKIMKGLGFNVLILPKDQDLAELHLEGTLSKTMPEEYVHRLAQSKIVTINHLLPSVVKKLTWPEQQMTIILQGTRGEVPILFASPKKPILEAVPRGKILLGHELLRRLNQKRGEQKRGELKPGDKIKLLGREFTFLKAYEERGNADDNTAWIHLKDAQELLHLENLIHAILALECHCAGERLAAIRTEIAAILPGTQVIERGPPALARAEARTQAKDTAVRALELETASRRQLRQQHENFAAVLVPLVLIGCAVWIGFLAFGNVRERSMEIGILRAIGFRSAQILSVFLGKAMVTALAGAVLGILAGGLIGLNLGELAAHRAAWPQLFSLKIFCLGGGLALLLSGLGSWLPAMLAARQDPAVVLQKE